MRYRRDTIIVSEVWATEIWWRQLACALSTGFEAWSTLQASDLAICDGSSCVARRILWDAVKVRAEISSEHIGDGRSVRACHG